MPVATSANNSNALLEELQKPKTQQLLLEILEKLPKYEQSIQAIANLVDFGRATLTDQQTLQKYDELLGSYNLNLSTVEAFIGLLERLPKLLQMIDQLENIVTFVSAILQDQQTLDTATNSIKQYTEPVKEKSQQCLQLVKDIQQQATKENEPIKLLTIMKWLKDPSIQKSLRYVQATLHVLHNKK